MISSEKLLIILIGLNMLIGMSFAIINDNETNDTDFIDYEKDLFDQTELEVEKETGLWGGVKRWVSSSWDSIEFGNTITWGYEISTIFLDGLNPLSISPEDFTNTVEKEMARIILLFRSLISAYAIFELFRILKNKKNA